MQKCLFAILFLRCWWYVCTNADEDVSVEVSQLFRPESLLFDDDDADATHHEDHEHSEASVGEFSIGMSLSDYMRNSPTLKQQQEQDSFSKSSSHPQHLPSKQLSNQNQHLRTESRKGLTRERRMKVEAGEHMNDSASNHLDFSVHNSSANQNDIYTNQGVGPWPTTSNDEYIGGSIGSIANYSNYSNREKNEKDDKLLSNTNYNANASYHIHDNDKHFVPKAIHTRLRPHSSQGAAVFSTLRQPLGFRSRRDIRVAQHNTRHRMKKHAKLLWNEKWNESKLSVSRSGKNNIVNNKHTSYNNEIIQHNKNKNKISIHNSSSMALQNAIQSLHRLENKWSGGAKHTKNLNIKFTKLLNDLNYKYKHSSNNPIHRNNPLHNLPNVYYYNSKEQTNSNRYLTASKSLPFVYNSVTPTSNKRKQDDHYSGASGASGANSKAIKTKEYRVQLPGEGGISPLVAVTPSLEYNMLIEKPIPGSSARMISSSPSPTPCSSPFMMNVHNKDAQNVGGLHHYWKQNNMEAISNNGNYAENSISSVNSIISSPWERNAFPKSRTRHIVNN